MTLKITEDMSLIEKLQVAININTYKIQKLEEIRQITKKYDGKVFNKNIVV